MKRNRLIFKLNNVPEDEIIDIHCLLEEASIPTYETNAGFWSMGVSAIWLKDIEDFERARGLIDEYQMERYKRSREEQQGLIEASMNETFIQRVLSRPLQFLMAILAIAFVLGLSIYPFLSFDTAFQ